MLVSSVRYSRWIATQFLIAALAFPLNSQAQTFIQSPNQAFAIDLDTRDGAFSSWDNNDLGPISGLRATIQVSRIGKDNKWLPYFLIYVKTSDGGFGLALEADNWKPPVMVYTYSKSKKAEKIGLLNVDEKTNIQMDWSKTGTLIVRLGNDMVRELPLSTPITGLRVSASTGELTLSSIALGQFAR